MTPTEQFLDNISDGGNVRLYGDIHLDTPITIGESTTIDLNGHSIEASLSSELFTVTDGNRLVLDGEGMIQNRSWIARIIDGGEVNIKGGTYISNYEGFKAVGGDAVITINGGMIQSVETAVVANRGASIEMNDGYIYTTDNFGIATNGSAGEGNNTIVMNGGRIESHITSAGYEACGVYIANDDSFTMNGGEIISENGAGLCIRGGDVYIYGGTITATGEAGTTGTIGDAARQMSKSAIIFDEAANYPGNAGMSLYIQDGIFTGVDHSVEILSDKESPNVTVVGGTFTPEYEYE